MHLNTFHPLAAFRLWTLSALKMADGSVSLSLTRHSPPWSLNVGLYVEPCGRFLHLGYGGAGKTTHRRINLFTW